MAPSITYTSISLKISFLDGKKLFLSKMHPKTDCWHLSCGHYALLMDLNDGLKWNTRKYVLGFTLNFTKTTRYDTEDYFSIIYHYCNYYYYHILIIPCDRCRWTLAMWSQFKYSSQFLVFQSHTSWNSFWQRPAKFHDNIYGPILANL